MNDSYYELLVAQEPDTKDKAVKVGLPAAGIACIIAGILVFWPILIVGAVLLIAGYVFLIPRASREYEYLFIQGDFSVDVVYSQSKRKKMMEFSVREADIVAPVNSHRLDYYNNNQNLKVVDFSSGNPDHRRFAVITRLDSQLTKIIIEPDQKLEQMMIDYSPSKVFRD